jgi:hypothetical protein
MSDHLLVGVLGERDAGKSTTWYTLFDNSNVVTTTKNLKTLHISDSECLDVFIINGSPEEREKDVEEIILKPNPTVVLCSIQYSDHGKKTIDYFIQNGYFLFIHWLNPGYRDLGKVSDNLGIIEDILNVNSLVGIRDGKCDPRNRVEEMRSFIRGWAATRGLIKNCR